MIDNGSGKRQIAFHENQTHVRGFEVGMLGFAILCAIVVLLIVMFTDIGNTFRQTA